MFDFAVNMEKAVAFDPADRGAHPAVSECRRHHHRLRHGRGHACVRGAGAKRRAGCSFLRRGERLTDGPAGSRDARMRSFARGHYRPDETWRDGARHGPSTRAITITSAATRSSTARCSSATERSRFRPDPAPQAAPRRAGPSATATLEPHYQARPKRSSRCAAVSGRRPERAASRSGAYPQTTGARMSPTSRDLRQASHPHQGLHPAPRAARRSISTAGWPAWRRPPGTAFPDTVRRQARRRRPPGSRCGPGLMTTSTLRTGTRAQRLIAGADRPD